MYTGLVILLIFMVFFFVFFSINTWMEHRKKLQGRKPNQTPGPADRDQVDMPRRLYPSPTRFPLPPKLKRLEPNVATGTSLSGLATAIVAYEVINSLEATPEKQEEPEQDQQDQFHGGDFGGAGTERSWNTEAPGAPVSTPDLSPTPEVSANDVTWSVDTSSDSDS